MDVNKRSQMMDTALALLLAVLLQGLWLAGCAANSSPLLGSGWGNPRRYVHLQTSSDLSNFYLEITSSGHVRKTTLRSPYSGYHLWFFFCVTFVSFHGRLYANILIVAVCFISPGVILIKADTRERVAILGIKSNRYLCMDSEGTQFSSVRDTFCVVFCFLCHFSSTFEDNLR